MTTEKAAKLAANLLILAFKDATFDDGTIPVTLEPRGARLAPSNRRYILRKDGLTAIRQAARRLVPLIDFYPLDKCISQLTGIVVEVKDAGTPLTDAHEKIRDQVLQFLREFSAQGQWEVVYAVRGLKPSDFPFAVGPCQFYFMDDDQFVLWGRRMASGRFDPPADTRLPQSWFEQEQAIRGQLVAAVRVQAIDHEHAGAKGRSRIEEVLNVLRYAQLATGFVQRPFPELGISIREWWENPSIVIQLDNPNFGTSKNIGQILAPLAVRQSAPGWKGLEQLIRLDLSVRNELQLRITTCMQWIGQAALAPSAPIRLVALVTALEALMIEESETLGKKSKLASRLSRLVATTDVDQQRVAKEATEVYEVRSECIHAGLVDVEKEEVMQAVGLVAQALEVLCNGEPYCKMSSLADVLNTMELRSPKTEPEKA